MPMQGSLSVERMCQMARVSRAVSIGHFRNGSRGKKAWRCGRPSSGRSGAPAALRLSAGDGGVEAQRDAGEPQTSRAHHARRQPAGGTAEAVRDHHRLQPPLEIYLNLARRMKLTGMDQLWMADITYIRLKAEFVYLAVILDGFSRKVVGWKLDRTLASRLATEALEMAIKRRKPLPGLVHHSDRGIQYASAEYVAILKKHGMVPSMSRPANPYDNASCESFIKTLKREEIYANDYENLEHLQSNIEEFIERYYNQKRLHSALGYRSPEEFEAASQAGKAGDDTRCHSDIFPGIEGGSFDRAMLGKGLKRRPFPRPLPCSENQRDELRDRAVLRV